MAVSSVDIVRHIEVANAERVDDLAQPRGVGRHARRVAALTLIIVSGPRPSAGTVGISTPNPARRSPPRASTTDTAAFCRSSARARRSGAGYPGRCRAFNACARLDGMATKLTSRKSERNESAYARTDGSVSAKPIAAAAATPAASFVNGGRTRADSRPAAAAAARAGDRRTRGRDRVEARREEVQPCDSPAFPSSAWTARCRIVPTFDSLSPVARAMSRLVISAPYFSAISSRSRSESVCSSTRQARRVGPPARSRPRASPPPRHHRGLVERHHRRPRAVVVDRGVPRDREQPGRERALVAPVTVAAAPGLLERDRGQVLGVGRVAAAVAEEVEDAWQLLGIHRVPVDLVAGDPPDDPRRHRAFGGHSVKYTGRAAVSPGGQRAELPCLCAQAAGPRAP